MGNISSKINWPATRERMHLLNNAAWARHWGMKESTVRVILAGIYPSPTGAEYLKCLNALRHDGFLVEESDAPDADQRAA